MHWDPYQRGRGLGGGGGSAHGGFGGGGRGGGGGSRGRGGFHSRFKSETIIVSPSSADKNQPVMSFPYDGRCNNPRHALTNIKHLAVVDGGGGEVNVEGCARTTFQMLDESARRPGCKWKAQIGVLTFFDFDDHGHSTLGAVRDFANKNKGCSFYSANFFPSGREEAATSVLEELVDNLCQSLGGQRTSRFEEHKLILKSKDGISLTIHADPSKAGKVSSNEILQPDVDESILANVICLPFISQKDVSTQPLPVLPITYRFQVKEDGTQLQHQQRSDASNNPVRLSVDFDKNGFPILDSVNASAQRPAFAVNYSRTQHSLSVSVMSGRFPIIVNASLYYREVKELGAQPETSIRFELRVVDDVSSEDAWISLFRCARELSDALSEFPRDTAPAVRLNTDQRCKIEMKYGSCYWVRCHFLHLTTQCPREITHEGCSVPKCQYVHSLQELERELQGTLGDHNAKIPRCQIPVEASAFLRGFLRNELSYQFQRIAVLANQISEEKIAFFADPANAVESKKNAAELALNTRIEVDLHRLRQQLGSFVGFVEGCRCDFRTGSDDALRWATHSCVRMCRRLRAHLPVFSQYNDVITWALGSEQYLVVKGETGSGKSTQIPQYLADVAGQEYISNPNGKLPRPRVVYCTQPRSLAAISLAQRVADEYSGQKPRPIGLDVGYIAGGQRCVGGRCRIIYVTERAMLNLIARQEIKPENTFAVFVDEAHERSIVCDMLIGLLRSYKHKVRVVVGSATVDTEVFRAYFSSCPVLHVAGRTFPIEVQYRARYSLMRSTGPSVPDSQDVVQEVVNVVMELLSASLQTDGDGDAATREAEKSQRSHEAEESFSPPRAQSGEDILCFMSSAEDAEDAKTLLGTRLKASSAVKLLLLSGRQTVAEQQEVFAKMEARKVIFTTQVAETSVTIDGVKFVIDTGLARTSRYDANRNDTALCVLPISASSADQRKGRAGRTAPGVCIRLYSELDYKCMEPGRPCELHQTPLHTVHLKLCSLERNMRTFPWIDPPQETAISRCRELLLALDAISPPRQSDLPDVLTDFGKQALRLEISNIFVAKLLCLSANSAVRKEAAGIAAIILNVPSLFFRPSHERSLVDKVREEDGKQQSADIYGDLLTLQSLCGEFQHLLQRRGKKSDKDPAKKVLAKPSAETALLENIVAMQTKEEHAILTSSADEENTIATEVVEVDDLDDTPLNETIEEDTTTAAPPPAANSSFDPSSWCKHHYLRLKGQHVIAARQREIENRLAGIIPPPPSSQPLSTLSNRELLLDMVCRSFPTQIAVSKGERRFVTLNGDECLLARNCYLGSTTLPEVVTYASLIRVGRSVISLVTPVSDARQDKWLVPETLNKVRALLQLKVERVSFPCPTAFFETYSNWELSALVRNREEPHLSPSVHFDFLSNALTISGPRANLDRAQGIILEVLGAERARACNSLIEVPLNGSCRLCLRRGGKLVSPGADALPSRDDFVKGILTLKATTETPVTDFLRKIGQTTLDAKEVVGIRPLVRNSESKPALLVTLSSPVTANALKKIVDDAANTQECLFASFVPCVEFAPSGGSYTNEANVEATVTIDIQVTSEDPEDPETIRAPPQDDIQNAITCIRELLPNPQKADVMIDHKRGIVQIVASLGSFAVGCQVASITRALQELNVVEANQRLYLSAQFRSSIVLPPGSHWKELCKLVSSHLQQTVEDKIRCRVSESNGVRSLLLIGMKRGTLEKATAVTRQLLQVNKLALWSADEAFLFSSKIAWRCIREACEGFSGFAASRFILDYSAGDLYFLGPAADVDNAKKILSDALNKIKQMRELLVCHVVPAGRRTVRQWMEDTKRRDDFAKIQLVRGVLRSVAAKEDNAKLLTSAIHFMSHINHASNPKLDPKFQVHQSSAKVDGTCPLCTDQLHETSSYRLSICGHAFCLECIAMALQPSVQAEIPVLCPECNETISAIDISLISPTGAVHLAERQRQVLGDFFSPTSCLEPCPQQLCQGFFCVSTSRRGHCEGCDLTFCKQCLKMPGRAVVPFHEGPCMSVAFRSAASFFNATVLPILEARLQCPNPKCKEPFGGFDGCYAVTCGKCNKYFCGFCLFWSDADVHPHVKACPKNPGNSYFAPEKRFYELRDDEAKAKICDALSAMSPLPSTQFCTALEDLIRQKGMIEGLHLDQFAAGMEDTSRGASADVVNSSNVAQAFDSDSSWNPRSVEERMTKAIAALRQLDPQSAFSFSPDNGAFTISDAQQGLSQAGILQKASPTDQNTDPMKWAIWLYTSNEIYSALNKTLRGKLNKKMYEYLKPYMSLLLKGLGDRLTNENRTVYRGVSLSGQQRQQYKVGRTVLWRAMTSCSFNKTVSQGFGNVLFQIKLSRFAAIADVSAYSSEAEVLIPPFTRLRIVSANAHEIHLEQIVNTA